MLNQRRPNKANSILTKIVLFVMMVLAGSFILAIPASAATVQAAQCNYADTDFGGLNTECEVTVVNNLDMATGVTSSTVTLEECHGFANAEPTCVTTTTTTEDIVTDINQCNNSTTAGGGTVICNVNVTNNITGDTTLSAATVNQCVGSGTGGGTEPTLNCDPIQSTTNAAVDQCNGSGNGGGGTERVKCSVASESTSSVALPVSITQCNDSGNGGGAYVTCFARILNNITPAAVVLPPTDTDGDGTPDSEDSTPNGEPTPTPVDTDGDGTPDSEDSTPNGEPTPTDGGTPVITPPAEDVDGGTPVATPPTEDVDSPTVGTPSESTPSNDTPSVGTPTQLAETGAEGEIVLMLAAGLLLGGIVLLVVAKKRTRSLVTN